MTAQPPAAALALAVRLLEAQGFSVGARNARGDSLYLRRAGCALAIRVSNHARTPKQRRRHPEVATSLVIRSARSGRQVEAMVASALRAFAAAQAREPAS